MANRPVFVADEKRIVRIVDTEFEYAGGFAKSQKQKCVQNLHSSYQGTHPGANLLDISRYSTEDLGVSLSAFNLTLKTREGADVRVELAFQAGKVFANGGPYIDLLEKDPGQAKKDERLKTSGRIIGFRFDGMDFQTEPRKLFYTWLYLKGLENHSDLANQLMEYNAFTDIVFNPEKSENCQAHAAAVYVALRKRGDLEKAMESTEYLASILASEGRINAASSGQIYTAVPGIHEPETAKTEEKKERDPAPAPHEFKIGDKVCHPKYGEGTIMKVEASGSSCYLHVKFPDEREEKELSGDWVLKNCEIMQ